MEKILTAEDFYALMRKKLDFNGDYPIPDPVIVMKEFAKLHVEAALKEASKLANPYKDGVFSPWHQFANEEALINCYPSTNIV